MCFHFPLFSVTVTLARLLSTAPITNEEERRKVPSLLFREYAKENCKVYVSTMKACATLIYTLIFKKIASTASATTRVGGTVAGIYQEAA